MNYRDILGFTEEKTKKKVVKQPSKPSITEKLSNEFGALNEWTAKPPTEKRWSKPMDGGLTEFEQQGGKDNVNEGPAGDYAKAYENVKKTYGAFWDSVHDFEYILKSKGLGKHAKELNKQYKNGVEKFYKFFFKMMDKLQ